MIPPRVLVVVDYFLPGFRAGGPIRAIANSRARLSGSLTFAVVTRNHDTDGVTYRDVRSSAWNSDPRGAIYYAPRLTRDVLETCIRESSADVIWLNSFFSRASLRVLLSRRFGRITTPVLLSPRGEFSPGALSRKRLRKTLAMWGLGSFGFLRDIHWVASSDLEADEIRTAVGGSDIAVVPESVREPLAPDAWPVKQPDALRMVFASRVDAKKNLQFLLEALAHARGRVHLDVIGPVEHAAYWDACRRLVKRLPANVTVAYRGEMPHAELEQHLRLYDVMALPTLGENFGHVIVEAWAAGCPVLVSDRTPWRRLVEEGGGWDLPLEQEAWVTVLERCVRLRGEEHDALRRRALERARGVWQDGIRGDEILEQLIVTVARRRDRTEPTPLSPEHEANANPTPCR
jgi:glycosyltransferase involved in cell wall biosynthesis